MVTEEKMQQEIDKATEALAKKDLIRNYATLLRIKYSSDLEQELDRELKVMEVTMKHLDIKYESLKTHFTENEVQKGSEELVRQTFRNRLLSQRNRPSCTL